MRRRKTAIFFLVLGISLSALAIALNVGWILLNLREVVLLVLGIIFFALIITGLILNTIFLVREIRRSEQHDAFLNAVTHELKTPIASLKLYLDTLKSRDVTEAKRREFYEVMTADSDRLLNTVEQVLQASRTREAGRVMDVDELKVGDVIRDAIAAVLARYNLNEAVIRFTETGALETLGDREELYTAFLNLLDNAVKYSPEEKKISVRAKPSATGTKIDIVVRDNGVGIPPADLKRVFKRFYRVPGSASRSIKGTGLGLFIVEAIVKRHGGRIRAESKGEGRGTTFFIQLPRN
jgi:signal transduction histidine kinase